MIQGGDLNRESDSLDDFLFKTFLFYRVVSVYILVLWQFKRDASFEINEDNGHDSLLSKVTCGAF